MSWSCRLGAGGTMGLSPVRLATGTRAATSSSEGGAEFARIVLAAEISLEAVEGAVSCSVDSSPTDFPRLKREVDGLACCCRVFGGEDAEEVEGAAAGAAEGLGLLVFGGEDAEEVEGAAAGAAEGLGLLVFGGEDAGGL
jgi:hypothetical protein